VERIIERLKRCAATEKPGAFDADLANAIIQEEKRNLVAELEKLPKRFLAALERLPAEKRNDPAETERILDEETKAFLAESGLNDPKLPRSSP
jgi:hypothetical protein